MLRLRSVPVAVGFLRGASAPASASASESASTSIGILARRFEAARGGGRSMSSSKGRGGGRSRDVVATRSTTTTTTTRSSRDGGPVDVGGGGGAGGGMVLYDSLSETYKPLAPRPAPPPPPRLASADDDEGGRTDRNSPPRRRRRRQLPRGIAWYTCGPTTYDSAHLGHARTYVVLDVIRRSLLAQNSPTPPPLFAMNVTDVDDKILDRAKERKIDPMVLSRTYEEEFWEDMESLNVMRPDLVLRVTESMDDIVSYIEKIVRNGMAYVVEEEGGGTAEGGVYFDVRSFEERTGKLTKYGKLAPPAAAAAASSSPPGDPDGPDGSFFSWDNNDNGTSSAVRKSRRGRKRDPRDFALWKRRKAGEDLYWDSPWGEGRPGWHIECSAMIQSVATKFQSTHDVCVHAGGVDLKFPHHTNEIAQAEAYRFEGDDESRHEKAEWIPHWVHTGHLHIRGMKMSKSLKNFVTIRELLSEGEDGEAEGTKESSSSSSSLSSPADDFRLWCLGLSGSYRGPATYSDARLDEARATREKIVRFLLDGEEWIRRSSSSGATTASPPRRWGDEERGLFDAVREGSAKCRRAVLGRARSVDGDDERRTTPGGFDLDGSTYVSELVGIAEAGGAYLDSSEPGERPVEAVRHALRTLRGHLSLVGFTDRTVRAGADGSGRRGVGAGGNVVGGERALAEELARLRTAVRDIALDEVKRSKKEGLASSPGMLDILQVCDDARDVSLPMIGLELRDAKGGDALEETGGWRFCVPRKQCDGSGETRTQTPVTRSCNPKSTSVEDFFRVGIYEGLFSDFDEHGIPIRNSDGTEVSKRMLKKLLRKRDKYIQKHYKDNDS